MTRFVSAMVSPVRHRTGVVGLLVCLCAWPAAAQTPAGTVAITINDPSGASIRDAQVTLTGNGIDRVARADVAGAAVFEGVPPGRYDILAAHPGFAPGALRDVDVRADERTARVLQLQITAVTDQVDVTGRLPYAAGNATAATKTDAALIETPVSIQVVPQVVLLDKQITSLPEAVTGQVSGVIGRTGGGYLYDNFIIRGFAGSGFGDAYRNGLYNRQDIYDISNIERVEVLKGPAAVLYGRIEPGGLVNYVTKRPQPTARYAVHQQVGSFDQYRTWVDATGPIAGDRRFLYRVNASYFGAESFRDFVTNARGFIAPSLTWEPNDRFNVTVDVEHKRDSFQADIGWPAIGNAPAPLPIEQSNSDGPQTNALENTLAAFNWTWRFHPRWSFTQRFQRQDWSLEHNQILASSLQANNQFQNRSVHKGNQDVGTTSTNLDLQGTFQSGVLRHRILIGVDHFRAETESTRYFGFRAAPAFDIFNPVYGQVDWDVITPNSAFYRKESWTGLYVQDQISFDEDRWHVLAGVRFDSVNTGSAFNGSISAVKAALESVNDKQVSPRLGLLYRVVPAVSLYTSYSRSFSANNGVSASGEAFDPQQGEQYEVGTKLELGGQRVTSTVAWFDLTKDNLLTTDLNNPLFQILAGEARSTGLEADIAGQVSDRLSLLATYAYTNARYVRDNAGFQGKSLENVPKNQGSLWGTYDATRSLRVGFGVAFVGERQGDPANTVRFDSYQRADAMVAYVHGAGRARLTLQLNVNNLFDAEYFTSSGDRVSNTPGRPRNVLVSAGVGF